jgi:transketolase
MKLTLIPKSEFDRVVSQVADVHARLDIVADMNRANALVAVKRAGSGHLGSSFSAMDIVVHLYYKELNTIHAGIESLDRDIYFSSKGHDVPGLYAVLFSLGILSEKKLLSLRRYGGLDGHPDVSIPGIEANSGSLGMGMSKGRGMAWAKTYLKYPGRVFVLTGDGEWQEGQNFEALQGAAALQTKNLMVIVDHNKIQSDKRVDQIVRLGEFEDKLRSFGWYVERCDGHNHEQLDIAFSKLKGIIDKPKILIADTIKGRGVSFMEHPQALKDGSGYYKWHSGAPGDEYFERAYREIIARIDRRLNRLGIGRVITHEVLPDGTTGSGVSLEGEPVSRGEAKPSLRGRAEFVADAFGASLVEIAARRKDVVVLDADLAADCRIREFELSFPERFIECGIAEQDMVSMAGGLARQGVLPVVNSFASFLASRANEQIYNNASEGTKIIYAFHYAGLIPAGPGKSHQSVRDISLVGALPNCEIIQPANAVETQMAVQYAIDQADVNVVLRLVIGPSPRTVLLPDGYRFERGRGAALTNGQDLALFAYGPVMLNEALLADEILSGSGLSIRVINMPWLNRFDTKWLAESVKNCPNIFVVEDHAVVGGLADRLFEALWKTGLIQDRQFHKVGVEGYPVFGTPPEALRHHGLDGESLAHRIRQIIAEA